MKINEILYGAFIDNEILLNENNIFIYPLINKSCRKVKEEVLYLGYSKEYCKRHNFKIQIKKVGLVYDKS